MIKYFFLPIDKQWQSLYFEIKDNYSYFIDFVIQTFLLDMEQNKRP